jgi:two-component system response regulator ResD
VSLENVTTESRARVLVVDDNDSIRVLVRRVLEREKVQVDEAVDGTDALEKIAACDYDAIILDLMMPRQNGLAVISTLCEQRPELLERVIVMSAAKSSEDDLLTRVRYIVMKPFRITELAQLVRESIVRRSAAAP